MENDEVFDPEAFDRGDWVAKTKGDYVFYGQVVCRFTKLTRGGKCGVLRYVVQNDDGILHIFSPEQLTPAPPDLVKISG